MEHGEYAKMCRMEDVHWWYLGLHDLVLSTIRSIQISSPFRILDAGCGTGGLMKILKGIGRVDGLDGSAEAVRWCLQRGLGNVSLEDLNIWEAPESSYDIIVSNDVICCSEVGSDLAVLKMFRAALKSGGSLIMNLPAFPCLRRGHDLAVHIERRYVNKPLRELLERAGFRVVKANYRLPLLFVFILMRKVFFNLSRKGEDIRSDLKPLPGAINRWLLNLHKLENRLLSAGLKFPVGSSIFVVAKKADHNLGETDAR